MISDFPVSLIIKICPCWANGCLGCVLGTSYHKADLLKELKQLRFTPMSELNAIMKGKDNRRWNAGARDKDGEGGDADAAPAKPVV